MLQTCGREPTGPAPGTAYARAISLSLEFSGSPPNAQSQITPFDHIRLSFSRVDGTLALDRTIAIAPLEDSLVLNIEVPLSPSATASGEYMDVIVRCIAPLGDTVYAGGPVRSLIRPGSASSPVAVALHYTGTTPEARVTHLSLNTLAATAVAGTLLGGAGGLTVTALDSANHTVAAFTQPVTIALANARGATLHGTTTKSATGGVARFTDLSISNIATGYTLIASTAGVLPVTSTPFAIVTSGTSAASMAFGATEPIATTAAGTVLGSAAGGITVNVLDAAGAVVTSFSGPVTMAIGQNPTGASLGGTSTVNAVNGIATFTDLIITKAGSGYTLVASAAGLPNVTSNSFAIVAAPAHALSLVGGNNQSALISVLLPTPLKVAVADAFGNPVSGTTVVWSVLGGGGLLQNASTTTDASGVASNVWTLGALVGTQTASAAVNGLTGSPVNFTATATIVQQVATHLTMSVLQATAIAGSLLTGSTVSASVRGAP